MKLAHGVFALLAAAGVLGILGVAQQAAQAQDYPLPQGVFTTMVAYNPTVALTAVTTPQIPANSRRSYLRCTSDSGAVVYLNPGGTPAIGTGIRLNATGGNTLEMSDRLGNMWTGSLSAITASTAAPLLCVDGSN